MLREILLDLFCVVLLFGLAWAVVCQKAYLVQDAIFDVMVIGYGVIG